MMVMVTVTVVCISNMQHYIMYEINYNGRRSYVSNYFYSNYRDQNDHFMVLIMT